MLKSSHLKKRTLISAVLAASFGLPWLGAPTLAATLDEIKDRGYMIVATEDNNKPFEFFQDGKPTGLDNELLVELRKCVPFEIHQKIIPWTGLLAGVTTGKYDVALTAALVTKERVKSLDFTMPTANQTVYYVKRKGDESISSVKDLSGKTLGVQAGSAQLEKVPQLEAMLAKTGGEIGKIVKYPSYPEAYQDLALGRVDYVIHSILNLRSLVNAQPDIFEIGQPVASLTVSAWAVKKGNTGVLSILNECLGKMKKSGKLAELQEKWLGQSFPDLPVKYELEP